MERHEVALAAGTPAGVTADPDELLRSDIAEGLSAGDSANALAKRLAQKYSRKKRDVYNLALELQG